jgi:hypothetical protein
MAHQSDRSMNADMRIGAVDGRLRFLRPNAVNAEMEEAVMRMSVLDVNHYGYIGAPYGDLAKINAVLPGAVHPLAPIRIGKHEVVDPL